ncbi:MAG: hypothetical protein L0216_17740 [Planctomycetales bacterium]|nr:hypothetical protein [Planctomycetales bacterium]
MRIRIAAALVLAALAAPALAQVAKSPEELKRLHEAKLAEPFVGKAPWVTDYNQARDTAKAGNKLIFAYFTRSYAP